MGAALGCCEGPSPSADYDIAMLKKAQYQYPPRMGGHCDAVEKSLLRKLQRSFSSSWSLRSGDHHHQLRSPHTGSHATNSRYGLDDHYESESDTEEPSGNDSNASATSGSRMLCDFYNLVLECDHSKFYVDAHGRRIKGAYLTQVAILDDYFDTSRRTTVGSRRRRRESVDQLAALPYQPPNKLKNLGSYERSSTMSLLSNDDTNKTMASESDYWATFLDEETIPSSSRPRRESSSSSVSEQRRSWVLHDLSLYGGIGGHDLPPASSSSLLLFSPVNTDHSAKSPLAVTSPTTEKQFFAMPIEGTKRTNLWGAEDLQPKTNMAMGIPPVFSSAAVAERRRASLTMMRSSSSGTTTAAHGTSATGRRLSLHTIVPVAAS